LNSGRPEGFASLMSSQPSRGDDPSGTCASNHG
jgi:hypothetical protein